MKKFGKSYKNIGTASDPVYQLTLDDTGGGQLDSTLVEKFSEFGHGDGIMHDHTHKMALIDQAHQARVFGGTSYHCAGNSSNHGAFLNLPLPDGELADKVFEGHDNMFIISKTGKCYATGLNDNRQLGYKDGTHMTNNWIGQVDLPEDLKCIHVSTGSHNHKTFYYLMENGDLYGSGHNPHGYLFGLGINNNQMNTLGPAPALINTNVKQAYIGGRQWTTTSIGHTNTYYGQCGFVLKHDGTVETTGCNSYGQRGDGTTSTGTEAEHQNWHKVIQGGMIDQQVVDMKIVTNGHATTVYVRTSTGRLYAWGYNAYGQLGVGNTTHSGTPQITVTNDVVDFWVAGGSSASAYVLKTDGNIYSCGYNGYGQLGLGDTTSRNTWELVPDLSDKNITKMFLCNYGSETTAYALSDDKQLYAAGNNGYGQIGNGITSAQLIFTRSNTPTTPVQFRCYTGAYGDGVGFAVYVDAKGHLFGIGEGGYRLFDHNAHNKYSWTRIAGKL